MPDLLTIEEIASLLRVNPRTVRDKWTARPDFPRPKYAPTRRTRLWERSAIEAWASRRAS